MEFVYFALSILLHNSLLPPVKALHIIHFKTITNEMRKMIQNAQYPSDDPRNLQDLTCRQRICNEVLEARQYFTMNKHVSSKNLRPETSTTNPSAADNFQLLHGLCLEAEPFDQDVTYYKNQGRWQKQTLRLIKCLNNEKEWFVGFDQNNQRSYLIERMKYIQKTQFKWIAIIENEGTHADVDKFSGPERQQKVTEHFVKEVMQTDMEAVELQKLSLCFLSINEHGRLCGAIAESLDLPCSSSSGGLPHLNYIYTGRKRCVTREVEGLNNVFMTAKVVPCSVNQDRSIPQFYVLRDRKIPGVAYVLQQKADNVRQLRVVDQIQNLNVVLEIDPEENVRKLHEKVIRTLV